MEYKKFRLIDLIILTILALVAEFFGYFLVDRLETPFYLTFSLAICIIAMVRWGVVGGITYVLSGVVLFVLKFESDTAVTTFFYEVVANAAVCLPFCYFIGKNKNSIVQSTTKFLIVLLSCLVCLSLAKGLVLLIFNQSANGALAYFGYSLLINVMNMGLLFLLMKTKSQILTDMKVYMTVESQKQEEIENE